MKNFIKTFAAGLFSIMINASVVIVSVMTGLGFSVIHKMPSWTAIMFFIVLLLIGSMSILSIYLLGKCALGKIQLIGNKEKESKDNNE